MADFRIDVVIDPKRAQTGAKTVENSLRGVENRADALRGTLARVFAFVGIGAAIRQLATYAESFTGIQNRLRTVIEDQNLLNATFEDLTDIANRTRVEVDSLVALYQRGSIAAAELGASNEQLLLFVERVGQGLAVQGGSAASAAGALTQLSQALGSGIVRAEEFNSILEGAFPIAQAAARGIDRAGGSVAKLRQLIVNGEVTSREFFEGFIKGSAELEQQFLRTVPTIGQAFTVLRNNLIRFVGQQDQAIGATANVAQAVIFLAQNLAEFSRFAVAAGTALAVGFVQRGILSAVAGLKTLAVSLLTNPIFALATLLAVSTGVLVGFGDQIKVTADGFASLQDVVVVAFEAIKQIAAPALDAIGAAISTLFGGQIPTVREFAEAFALTFDQILGASRGTIEVLKEVFTGQLSALLDVAKLNFERFGGSVTLILLNLANAIIDLFRAPVTTVARAIQTLLSSVAGAAAVAAQLGAISEESRLAVEDSISGIEASIAQLAAKKPPPLIDVDDIKQRLGELDGEISTKFGEIGGNLKAAFLGGFQQDTIFSFVKGIFDEAEDRARRRAAEAAKTAADKQAALDAARAQGAQAPAGSQGPQFDPRNEQIVQRLLERVDAQKDLNEQVAILNSLFPEGQRGAEEYQLALEAIQLRGLQASTDLSAGFARAFIKMRQEAEDLAAVGEQITNVFADQLTGAVLDFTRTGKFAFKEFATSLLEDIQQIIVRLLVVQALSAVLGPVAGAAAGSAASTLTARAHGGHVTPGQAYMVGERGPEPFVPDRPGQIVPNGQMGQAPEVKLQVVNVKDEDEIPATISSGRADRAIMNVLQRNSTTVARMVGAK